MKSKPKNISLSVKDDVKVSDPLGTYKRWFNGAKHFFTVKSLPPKQ
jgi:hypothetical protein